MKIVEPTLTPKYYFWTGPGHYESGSTQIGQERAGFVFIFLLNSLAAPETAATPQRREYVRGTSSGSLTKVTSTVRQSTGEVILEIRRRSGLTWESLSKLFNVSRRTIHHWANGKAPSASHEFDIRKVLEAIRHVDEGSQRATHDRLLTTAHGSSPFDLLANRRYDDVMRQATGAGSGTSVWQHTALTENERARRRPVDPVLLLDAIQDRPKTKARSARVVRPARRKKSTE